MKTIDKNFFPGWVRKSISFTIDDGDVVWDRKFIDIVKKGGIKGTFNISTFKFDKLSPEGYRELYKGYEIANHVRLHPFAFKDGVNYTIKDIQLPETGEVNNDVYPCDDEDGLFWIMTTRGWRKIATEDAYIRLTLDCNKQIREVFGDVSAIEFVWPFHMQKNESLVRRLKAMDFYALRVTGASTDTTGFALPRDRKEWTYNATNVNLLEVAKLYREYPDDGELKTFIFGLHSSDYQKANNWCDLETFAEEYGNRSDEFWYATNYEIFKYEDAVKALRITEEEIENPSDLDVYLKIDGEPLIIEAHARLKF